MSFEQFIQSLSEEQKEKLREALSPQNNPDKNRLEENKKDNPIPSKRSNQDTTDFTMSIVREEKDVRKGGVPVNLTNKTNTFVDTGKEAKGKEFKTPEIKLTERRRSPPKKISQLCQKCDQYFDVHQTHAREFFVCDKCIKK
jgi:hypothetical protein